MGFVYKITNNVNGKIYIGKTEYANPVKRWKEHLRFYKSKKPSYVKKPLYQAMREYGIHSFTFEIIEETDNGAEREVYYIELYKSYGEHGYNATIGGVGRAYIDKKEKGKILSLYIAGESIYAIQNKTGHDKDSIRKILLENSIPIRRSSQYREIPVYQYRLSDRKLFSKHDSLQRAASAIGIKNADRHICEVCNGKRKSAYGYLWSYKQAPSYDLIVQSGERQLDTLRAAE